MKKIKILLFIMNDIKFFKPVLNSFLNDKRFECSSLLYLYKRNMVSKFSEQHSKQLKVIYNKKELKKALAYDNYEVIYFFSLNELWWKIIDYVPKDKKIIWWEWGYDVYENQARGLKPLIKLNLFKPNTKRLKDNNFRCIINNILYFFVSNSLGKYYESIRKRNFERIDYIQPVLPIEYNMLKSLSINGFKAKEFYSPVQFVDEKNMIFSKKNDGAIILGHSSHYSGNHIDIWCSIKQYIPLNRKVIVPLNYGDMYYAKLVKTKILNIQNNLMILDEFLPFEEYSKMMDDCSYAIYGAIRQQAIGNISNALLKGIKIFVYRDSIIYKHLKQWGFCIFAIEDINCDSFNIPLTIEEIYQNVKAFNNFQKYKKEKFELAINEIYKDLGYE